MKPCRFLPTLVLALFPLELSWSFLLPTCIQRTSPILRVTTSCQHQRPSLKVIRAHDILVTLLEGEKRTVAVDGKQTILEALEAAKIDAPHSCRSGLCTECAALVTANLGNVELQAAVLDPETSAKGFVLTCSATIKGPGVEMELGAGEKMYDDQYGVFRKDHEEAQVTKPGKWNIPFPDIAGA